MLKDVQGMLVSLRAEREIKHSVSLLTLLSPAGHRAPLFLWTRFSDSKHVLCCPPQLPEQRHIANGFRQSQI